MTAVQSGSSRVHAQSRLCACFKLDKYPQAGGMPVSKLAQKSLKNKETARYLLLLFPHPLLMLFPHPAVTQQDGTSNLECSQGHFTLIVFLIYTSWKKATVPAPKASLPRGALTTSPCATTTWGMETSHFHCSRCVLTGGHENRRMPL